MPPSLKVLLYGGRGWIGGLFAGCLRDAGHTVILADARADDAAAELDAVAPDRVVSLVGRTHGPGCPTIDYLEAKGRLVDNLRDNLYAPLVLAQACATRGIHMTYMGTGCIFTFDEAHPVPTPENPAPPGFTEGDAPNFFGSSYSIAKGYTDRLMHDLFNTTALNVRIRMPISGEPNPRNFITKIASYERICSIQNSMTVLDELLPLLVCAMEQKEVGTLNLTNPGTIEHNEVLALYKEIVDPAFEWRNFTYEEQAKVLAADRSNNRLDTARLEAMFPGVRPIREAVAAALRSYAAAASASASASA